MPNAFRKTSRQLLGLNARSLRYTGHNLISTGSKIAQDKLATKKLLQRSGLPTPRLYAAIKTRQELARFRWTKLPASFVIKPRSSYGGGGIIVIFGRNKKGNWVKADKTEIFIPQLRKHVLDTLDGNFSPSNIPDVALFEQRIKNHPDLKPYSKQGVADLRIIVYNHVPIMAMLRLPTLESHGKANLHAGGIGIGIDLARGITTTAIHRGHVIENLPGSRLNLSGIHIPHWKQSLLLATRSAQALGLAYSGVDIALDRDDGPTVLEINAKPGLEIQLANMAPLFSRLKRVEDLTVSTPERGVRLGQNLFGGDVEQEIEDVSGHLILGVHETVEILDADGHPHTVAAKVDTGAWRTTIDELLARKHHLHTRLVHDKKVPVRGALGKEKRPVIELTLRLRDRQIKTKAFIADRSHMKYNMIIGRRDLKGFLVDPTKGL
jgi:alpha-L-glutamate ligase-like protein